METPTSEEAAREAARHWSRLAQLAEFAIARHGFGDSDSGFGVTYPGDLDDYDRAQGEHIPEGFLRVYGFWGPPNGYEMLIPEPLYLAILEEALLKAGLPQEAEQVRALIS